MGTATMPSNMNIQQSVVVGTSGHVDHGKTSLVRALTGMDTDRLTEEKRRGITIDLGFAYSKTPQGAVLAFVDAPGHERFVHNMLAGAAGIDVVLLVVAADEGVMPQTREHVQICHLLGATQGLVVLSKCDLVDKEWLALSREDVHDALLGTFLESAPVFAVSTTTGEGLPALRSALEALPGQHKKSHATTPFRFIVDRSFAMKGFGTVVTGTTVSGVLGKGDEILLYPQMRKVRVRSMQSHGQTVQSVGVGMRAALNLASLHKNEVRRGNQLAHEHTLCVSTMLGVELRLLASAHELAMRARVRVHVGAQEVMARVVLLERERLLAGETQVVQLRLEQPLCACYGEHFVIRSYSPMTTIGGGRILDPAPGKLRKERVRMVERLVQLAKACDDEERLEQVVWLRGITGVEKHALEALSGLDSSAQKRTQKRLVQAGVLHVLSQGSQQSLYHADAILQLKTLIQRLIARHHREHPDMAGPTRPEMAGKLSNVLASQPLAELLHSMCHQGQIQSEGENFALPGHKGRLESKEDALLTQCLTRLAQDGIHAPRKTALLQACGLSPKDGTRLLNRAAHQGQVVRVDDEAYYVAAVLAEIKTRLAEHLKQHQTMDVAAFKALLNIGRKQAVELLEYFDAQHVTLRVGNHRILR